MKSLGTIILLFVLSATAGALAGAAAAFVVTPQLLVQTIPAASTSTLPIVPTSTTSEPSLISVEPRLAEPLFPSNFLTRRSSPVSAVYRKAKGVTNEERTLTDDRLLGQAVALTSDGWFVTTIGVVGTLTRQDLTIWHDGTSYSVTRGLIDRINGTVYLKIEASELSAPAFGDVDRLVLGSAVWTERLPGSFAPGIIASLTEGMGADPVSSETTVRRLSLVGNSGVGEAGSPVWDERGSLLGLIESISGKPRVAIPASSIAASFSSFLSNGSIRHASFGVRGTDLSVWRIDGDRGALPLRGIMLRDDRKTGKPAIVKDSAAAKAGFRSGDVILSVERDMLDGRRDLGEVIAEYRPETNVTFRVLRAGDEIQVPVHFGSVDTGEVLK
ncbi:MAG: S1C family serine protease [Patescibacteria group bacterium]|jgi:S1-C subfamily serine protease